MAKTQKKVTKETTTTASTTSTPAPKKGGGNTVMIVLLIVGVLCICCGGGGVAAYFMSQRAKREALQYTEDLQPSLIEDLLDDDYTTDDNDDSDYSFDGKLPSDFPNDIPVYPGAKIGLSNSTDNADGKSVYVTLSSTDSFEEVSNYYKEEVKDEGWDITSTTEFLGLSISASKGDRTLALYIYDGEDGMTYFTITAND